MRASEEFDIQRQLVVLFGDGGESRSPLRARVWWAHYPVGRWGSKAAVWQKLLGAKAGTPDLMFIHRGQCYWLEIKAKDGRLSKTQKSAHSALRRAGCSVATVRSVSEAVARLKKWGLVG